MCRWFEHPAASDDVSAAASPTVKVQSGLGTCASYPRVEQREADVAAISDKPHWLSEMFHADANWSVGNRNTSVQTSMATGTISHKLGLVRHVIRGATNAKIFGIRNVRFRFTIQSIFALVAFLSVCLGLIVWNWRLGSVLSIVLVSFVLILVGRARKLPLPKRCGLLGVVAMGLVLFVDITGGHREIWDGQFQLNFQVRIDDQETLLPISGAKVSAGYFELPFEAKYTTGNNGTVSFTENFACGGYDSYSGLRILNPGPPRPALIATRRYGVHVEAKEYEIADVSLWDVIDDTQWPRDNPNIPQIVVRLHKTK